MSESMVLDAILKDIRAKCLDCMGGHRSMVETCGCDSCPLHKHRMRRQEEPVIDRRTGAVVGRQMDMETMIKSQEKTA